MDYSNDPDHPAGPSPWSTSPQHNRNSFQSDPPSSPELSRQGESFTGNPPNRRLFEEDQDHARPEGVEPAHGDVFGQPSEQITSQPAERQQQKAPSQDQAQQHGQKSQPQRYHSAPRQPQKKQTPQFKLQAKITGLERTGRKDPILRFDVHVSLYSGENLTSIMTVPGLIV